MGFKVRDLLISVLGNNPGGCNPCTGTTGQGCNPCTGTVGCNPCTGTTGPYCLGGGCNPCTGTTADLAGFGCRTCTGTTGGPCLHAAALAACGVCTGVSPALGDDQRPQALAQLKQQLQGLLAEVEAEERRLEEAAFPQTAEEAEELEKKLEEALAEVRSRKAGLRKG
jgi:hypothetical protein